MKRKDVVARKKALLEELYRKLMGGKPAKKKNKSAKKSKKIVKKDK